VRTTPGRCSWGPRRRGERCCRGRRRHPSVRYRWILAHDEPPLIGYDQDLWVDRLHVGRGNEPEELLQLFKPLRFANVALWANASEEDRARVGMHAERGPESFALCFRMLAGHDRFHLAQARRALEAVSEG
jgi:hypothetical protein